MSSVAETSPVGQRQLRFTPPNNYRDLTQQTQQHLVLALNAGESLMETWREKTLSPRELQGKYMVALGRIGGETGSDGTDRRKPIYQRNSIQAERQAIAEAANALSALWKVTRSHKP